MGGKLIAGGLAALLLLPLSIPLLFVASAGGTADVLSEATPYVGVLDRAGSICHVVTPSILTAQVTQESGWDPKAQSPAGAQGISQFMPATWQEWGRDGDNDGLADVWNPVDSIWSQGTYMCHLADQVTDLIKNGEAHGSILNLTLAAYNAGLGRVKEYGGIPPFPETEHYVTTIVQNAEKNPVPPPGAPIEDGEILPTLSPDGTYLVHPKGATSGMLPMSVLCQVAGQWYLRCAAADQFTALNEAYTKKFGEPIVLVSAYRSYAQQVRTKELRGELAAPPGMSNHGWGMAIDIHAKSHGGEGSTKHNWLRENAPNYGWNWPSWARDKSNPNKYEPWHWEYVGGAA